MTFSPTAVLAIVGFIASVAAFLVRPSRNRRVTAQFVLSLLTWSLLWFATGSQFAIDSMTNLMIHMISHVLVMFIVPMGIIYSATPRSMQWLLPVEPRRKLLRWYYVKRKFRLPAWLNHPVTGALVMNVVMVTCHLSSVFDFLMIHDWAMGWVMEPAFLFSGLYFFHFILSSPPRLRKGRIRWQVFMIVVTMLEMFILAMAMSIFTKVAWYSVMLHPAMAGMVGMAGMTTSVSPATAFHQQQLGAAILWVCGDFWAVPCLVVLIRRLVKRDGSLFAALENQTSRLFST